MAHTKRIMKQMKAICNLWASGLYTPLTIQEKLNLTHIQYQDRVKTIAKEQFGDDKYVWLQFIHKKIQHYKDVKACYDEAMREEKREHWNKSLNKWVTVYDKRKAVQVAINAKRLMNEIDNDIIDIGIKLGAIDGTHFKADITGEDILKKWSDMVGVDFAKEFAYNPSAN